MIIARFQIGPDDVAVVVSIDQQGPTLFIVTAETDDDVQFRRRYPTAREAFAAAVEQTEGPIDDAIEIMEDEA
ncbi:MAG TPA: hypothetical protein VGQ52_13840 [Gemmatimonadaceae bacterium]|jgi:hypothetical protein|nr:hypothetical protein [Gemmatimonadaceae bacterium]